MTLATTVAYVLASAAVSAGLIVILHMVLSRSPCVVADPQWFVDKVNQQNIDVRRLEADLKGRR